MDARYSAIFLSLGGAGAGRSACGDNCTEVIQVQRNQFFPTHVGQPLEIRCPVRFCPNKMPHVLWNKYTSQSDKAKSPPVYETRWVNQTESSGVSNLVFRHLLLNDSGEYRCETNYTKSHFINITVTDTSAERSSLDMLLPYLYAGTGIFVCVVVVIILSVLSMQWCPEIPMTNHPSAHSNPGQVSPSETPLGSSPAHHPAQKPSSANQTSQNGHLYSNSQEEEEEEHSVWYAALNHELLSVATDLHVDHEQATEYAAIRRFYYVIAELLIQRSYYVIAELLIQRSYYVIAELLIQRSYYVIAELLIQSYYVIAELLIQSYYVIAELLIQRSCYVIAELLVQRSYYVIAELLIQRSYYVIAELLIQQSYYVIAELIQRSYYVIAELLIQQSYYVKAELLIQWSYYVIAELLIQQSYYVIAELLIQRSYYVIAELLIQRSYYVIAELLIQRSYYVIAELLIQWSYYVIAELLIQQSYYVIAELLIQRSYYVIAELQGEKL
ncbi:B- and T-lymphocyte attenuator [Merluccius polli]|uniref:B- and T-lymphocyte attenuator n=1 Tax=Merluccius polli TaxID=89951 RepID=A0AA47M4A1_MERPO|nr:B- and T-lymphocyte attenuator [Merluccius polli]